MTSNLPLSLSEWLEAPRLRAPFNLEARTLAGFTDEELADLAGH